LSLLVEILSGVLTGAGVADGVGSMYKDFTRTGDNGQFIMAIDVSRWMPMEDYYARLEGLVTALKAAGDSVLLPGEVRWQTWRDNQRLGIPIDPIIARAVEPLAREKNIALPW
jgi:LDH2 family malate/lactate/ureidoglycolate dehydrogenase